MLEIQDFPKFIYVSELPFMLQGWNGIYKKSDEMRNSSPVYKLKSYTLYFFIGEKIFKDKDIYQKL